MSYLNSEKVQTKNFYIKTKILEKEYISFEISQNDENDLCMSISVSIINTNRLSEIYFIIFI